MGYQSKTWSLSDEVVAVFEQFKAQGVSPNQLLLRIFDIGKINPNGGVGDDSDIEEMRRRHAAMTPISRGLVDDLASGAGELKYEREE